MTSDANIEIVDVTWASYYFYPSHLDGSSKVEAESRQDKFATFVSEVYSSLIDSHQITKNDEKIECLREQFEKQFEKQFGDEHHVFEIIHAASATTPKKNNFPFASLIVGTIFDLYYLKVTETFQYDAGLGRLIQTGKKHQLSERLHSEKYVEIHIKNPIVSEDKVRKVIVEAIKKDKVATTEEIRLAENLKLKKIPEGWLVFPTHIPFEDTEDSNDILSMWIVVLNIPAYNLLDQVFPLLLSQMWKLVFNRQKYDAVLQQLHRGKFMSQGTTNGLGTHLTKRATLIENVAAINLISHSLRSCRSNINSLVKMLGVTDLESDMQGAGVEYAIRYIDRTYRRSLGVSERQSDELQFVREKGPFYARIALSGYMFRVCG